MKALRLLMAASFSLLIAGQSFGDVEVTRYEGPLIEKFGDGVLVKNSGEKGIEFFSSRLINTSLILAPNESAWVSCEKIDYNGYVVSEDGTSIGSSFDASCGRIVNVDQNK